MDCAFIPGMTYELGWRFTLPDSVRERADKGAIDDLIARCSVARKIELAPFEIAVQPVPCADLIGNPYDLGVSTLASLCDLIDERLASDRLRLPSEDELEAAAGGALFPWGMFLPDGIPYGAAGTSFVGHEAPNSFGLRLLGNPYKVELSRTALKFGDGGAAICGGDPWPLAWLTLSPSFRLTDRDIVDCFPEALEECYVRPVKAG